MTFSIKTRKNTVDKLKNEELDLLVIGGGITGAGVALQATASGLKTGLVEMQDFAEGTSSRSTKLVHGTRTCSCSRNCSTYSKTFPNVITYL